MTEDKNFNAYDQAVHASDTASEKDWSLAREITSDGASGHWSPEDRARIDAITLKSLFFSEDWVYIVVDLIANKIASQSLRVMTSLTVNGKPQVEPAEDHPLQATFERPNPWQDYYHWMYSLVVDLILIGNAVNWRTDTGSIIPLPAETVSIRFTPQGEIKDYIAYENGLYDEFNVQRSQISFTPDKIIHIRRPNPSSMLWGLSPFVPGQKSVLFNRYSQEYLNSFYLKGASPGLALSIDADTNEANALRMLRSFEMAYTGRRNQRRTMILPKGVTATPFTSTIADQQLETLTDQNRENILALLKVPKHEVGIQTTGSLGSNETVAALKNFWASTLKPLMCNIAGALTHAYRDELGDRYFLEFDIGDVEILQDDLVAKAALATAMRTTMTLNEVREKIWQLPALDGGDALPGLAANPLTAFGPTPVTEPKPPELPTAPGDQKDIDPTDEPSKGVIRAAKYTSQGGTWLKKRSTLTDAAVAKGSSAVLKTTLAMFADQAEAAIKTAQEFLKDEKNYSRTVIKSNGIGGRRHKAATLKNREQLKKRITKAINSFGDQKKYTDGLLTSVNLGYDAALQVPFGLPNQDQIAALKVKNEDGRRALLAARGIDTFKNIDQTTTDRIMDIVDDGVSSSKSVSDIAKDIADEFDVSDVRAHLIARNEALTAVSIGQAAAMADAAKVVPNLKKMWLNAGDDRVRGNPDGKYAASEADHWTLQGDVADHDAAFKNGLQYPRDTDGPANETINCRCTWIMLPADEMGDVDA